MVLRALRSGRLLTLLGGVAVLLALVGRMVAGGAVVDARAADEVAALWAATVDCVGDQQAPDGTGRQSPAKPVQDQALLAIAAVLGDAPPLLAPLPALPLPDQMLPVRHGMRPAARAPPARAYGAALPRGPPALS